jgi:PAS domain S-box-containing protein
MARGCAALRDHALEQCEQGALTPAAAREICRAVDGVLEDALRRLGGQPPLPGAVDAQEARLRRAQQTFESLIETSPLPILSLDRQGIVQIWNRAAEELFGWSRAEVLGRPAPFVPEQRAEEEQQILSALYDGEVIRGREIRSLRRDGGMLDLSLSAAPLRDNGHGEVTGAIAILADISDQKRREQQAAEATRFREHFVSIVGHDLRNPLTAIVTSAQLLLRAGALNPRQARVVGRVASSADRMARMIDDLLDFARTRLGGGFPIHPRRIDLRELTEHAVEELLLAYPARSVRVVTAGADPWGNWDPDRLAQVVSNLVANAIQHSPDDGDVNVSLSGDDQVLVLRTHNGGAPIPREVLPHIFEPGRRGDARAGGLGLGLYIVEQIVLAHHGSIEARSSKEEGTTFTVVLPRKARGTV